METNLRKAALIDDLVIGAIFLAIGLLITFGTAAVVKSSPSGGTILFAYGPVVYGSIRMLRALMRTYFDE